MKRTNSQYERLMKLDRLIREGRYPNCLTFSADVEVSQKTVQRDVDFLRDRLRAPLAYDRVEKGFYYTKANWFLPSFNMSAGELTALLMSVQLFKQFEGTPMMESLEAVAGKIEGLLGDQVSVAPDMLFADFTVTAVPARKVREQVWPPVLAALRGRIALRMRYRSFDATKAKEWDFHPWHLANLQGEWYLFGARAAEPGKAIQLAMGKIERAVLTGDSFPRPEGFDIGKVLATTFGRAAIGGEPKQVRLLIEAGAGDAVRQYLLRKKHRFSKRKDGSIEMSFRAVGLQEVAAWVMQWGGAVKALEPAELKEMVEGMARKVLAEH